MLSVQKNTLALSGSLALKANGVGRAVEVSSHPSVRGAAARKPSSLSPMAAVATANNNNKRAFTTLSSNELAYRDFILPNVLSVVPPTPERKVRARLARRVVKIRGECVAVSTLERERLAQSDDDDNDGVLAVPVLKVAGVDAQCGKASLSSLSDAPLSSVTQTSDTQLLSVGWEPRAKPTPAPKALSAKDAELHIAAMIKAESHRLDMDKQAGQSTDEDEREIANHSAKQVAQIKKNMFDYHVIDMRVMVAEKAGKSATELTEFRQSLLGELSELRWQRWVSAIERAEEAEMRLIENSPTGQEIIRSRRLISIRRRMAEDVTLSAEERAEHTRLADIRENDLLARKAQMEDGLQTAAYFVPRLARFEDQRQRVVRRILRAQDKGVQASAEDVTKAERLRLIIETIREGQRATETKLARFECYKFY